MAWTTPTSRSTSNLITASIWNTDLVDNLVYLKSQVNAEIQIGAGGMISRSTNGAAPAQFETTTNFRNYLAMDYADGSNVWADFVFVLPSDYDGGTMTAKVIWTANSTLTDSVVWTVYLGCVSDDGTLDFSSGTGQSVTDANKSTAYDLNITAATSAITLAGTPGAGKLCHGSVGRVTGDASDTLAATARLLTVVLTYSRT